MARPKPTDPQRNTRATLVSHARDLIVTRGYARTSVDTINQSAHLSKGTFYHYFKSKSEILDAVVDQLTDEGWARARRALESAEGSPLERFEQFLIAARRWRIVSRPQTAEIMRAVFRPENSLLRERMRDRSISLAAPALAELFEDGVREGVFEIDDPRAAARVFLLFAYSVTEDMVSEVITSDLRGEELLARFVARGRAFLRGSEAILGVEPGSIKGPDVDLLASMVKAFEVSARLTNRPATEPEA